MKSFLQAAICFFLACLSSKAFSQVSYPCGKYFIEMNGTNSDGGYWSQVYNSPDITLAAWIQLTDVAFVGKRMDVFNRYDFSSTENLDFSLAVNEGGQVVFKARVIGSTSLYDSVLFNLKPEISKWYHVALTFEGTSHQCVTYINGKQSNSKTLGGALSYINTGSAFSHYMSFGKRYAGQFGGYSNFFKGYLDEAAYCQKALTSTQVETLASGIAAGNSFIKDNNLAVYHKFDDYPSQPNYGTYAGTLPTSGTYHTCPLVPSISLINPNPSMIMDNGTINTDISHINSNNLVSGAATDGVTKILLVAASTKPITFSLPDTKNGALSSLTNQSTLNTDITISPVNGKVVAIYEAPNGYGNNIPYPAEGRLIFIKTYFTDNPSATKDVNIHLVSPPVVLVHGMWSSPALWISSGFVNALKTVGFETPSLANYEKTNSKSFFPNNPSSVDGRNAVRVAIQDALNSFANEGIAATQVDVVGHSLGGLMTRSFTQEPAYTNKENYQKGYVHKLITIGTPHRGSPLGPELIASQNNLIILPPVIPGIWAITKVSIALSLVNMSIGECHEDFGINSNAIKALDQIKNPYMSYAIIGNNKGNGSALEQTADYNLFRTLSFVAFNHSFDEIMHSRCANGGILDNDLVVPISSQRGYINSNTTFWGTVHANTPVAPGDVTETNNNLIQNKVIQLLLSNDVTEFSPGFPAPSSFDLEDCSNSSQRQKLDITTKEKTQSVVGTQYVQIPSSIRGAVYSQNYSDSIKLDFKALGGAIPHDALFIIQDIGMFIVPSAPPYSVNFKLPKLTTLGSKNILLLVKDSTGLRMGDTTHIVISPNGTLDSLSVEPLSIRLDSIVREKSVYVHGFYKNGLEITDNDLTLSSNGTTYSSKLSSTIFKVSKDGLITAIKPGVDTLLISNSGKQIKAAVIIDSNYFSLTLYENTINFPSIPDKVINDEPFPLQASSILGQDVSFALVSGPVEVNNGIVVIKGTGVVTIKATSIGNSYIKDADPVIRSFNIINVLPLNLLNFSATLNNKKVDLKWQTTQEINTSYFIIEYSADGKNFSWLGQVASSTNTLTANNYIFTDLQHLQSDNFYRLKMVDKDGKFSYSKIVDIKIKESNNSFTIFPNPANNMLYVQAKGGNEVGTLRLFDASGRIVKKEEIVLNGNTSYPIDIKNLAKGVYNLLINSKTINGHQKFVKQ